MFLYLVQIIGPNDIILTAERYYGNKMEETAIGIIEKHYLLLKESIEIECFLDKLGIANRSLVYHLNSRRTAYRMLRSRVVRAYNRSTPFITTGNALDCEFYFRYDPVRARTELEYFRFIRRLRHLMSIYQDRMKL